ncbi:MAG TPA: 2-phospho-L-lactate guanylyltransferase [Candidatus Saccharimonadales bacterium]|nr:2-phospho-L-lactate guanylyltransferase [Candidatus Saccharimonadales bacterium]
MTPSFWIVVLIKDFTTAKSRLASVLEPQPRHRLAEMTAARALDAALALAPTLAVCGSTEAADLARRRGAAMVVEPSPSGQNPAAMLGLAEVVRRGAESVLLLSSDLPLVSKEAIRRLLAPADIPGSLAVAASADGREGTNALYLRPPGDFSLHFGEASLPKFAEEARLRGRRFIVHDDPSLALDLDEPSDLTAWRRLEPTG